MIPSIIIRLSLLANLWLASAAVAQERNSADRSNMAPDATAKPGPDQHDGDQEPHKETKTEPAEPTIATSTSICLLVEFGGAGAWAPIRVFRAIDLAGKRVQAERGRADDPQRPAGAGSCPIHARNRERPWFV